VLAKDKPQREETTERGKREGKILSTGFLEAQRAGLLIARAP